MDTNTKYKNTGGLEVTDDVCNIIYYIFMYKKLSFNLFIQAVLSSVFNYQERPGSQQKVCKSCGL